MARAFYWADAAVVFLFRHDRILGSPVRGSRGREPSSSIKFGFGWGRWKIFACARGDVFPSNELVNLSLNLCHVIPSAIKAAGKRAWRKAPARQRGEAASRD
jgi:hypothetical protein